MLNKYNLCYKEIKGCQDNSHRRTCWVCSGTGHFPQRWCSRWNLRNNWAPWQGGWEARIMVCMKSPRPGTVGSIRRSPLWLEQKTTRVIRPRQGVGPEPGSSSTVSSVRILGENDKSRSALLKLSPYSKARAQNWTLWFGCWITTEWRHLCELPYVQVYLLNHAVAVNMWPYMDIRRTGHLFDCNTGFCKCTLSLYMEGSMVLIEQDMGISPIFT